MAKGIVDGDEEPAVAAFRYNRFGEVRGQRVAVIDPGCLVARATPAREGGAADRTRNCDAVIVGGELLDRERNGGVVEADSHIDALGLEPAPRDGDTNIRLVLVIGKHDFDRLAE